MNRHYRRLKAISVGLVGLGALIIIPFMVFGQSGPGTISGKFVDPDGRVIVFENPAAVRVFAFEPTSAAFVEGTITKDGSYQISVPPTSSAAPRAWLLGSEIDSRSGFTSPDLVPTTVSQGVTVTNNIKLNRVSAVIDGQLTKSNGFLGSATVNLSRLLSGDPAVSSDVDGNGTYRFFVTVGKYLVSAFAAPANQVMNPVATEVNLTSGEVANVKLNFKDPTGVIRGSVRAADGSAASGASVFSWSDEGYASETISANDGTYVLKVNDGTWHVMASKNVGQKVYQSETVTSVIYASSGEKNLILADIGSLPAAKTVGFNADKGTVAELTDGARFAIPPGALPTGFYTLRFSAYSDEMPPSLGRHAFSSAYRIAVYGSDGREVNATLAKSAMIEIPLGAAGNSLGAAGARLLKILFRDPFSQAWRYAGSAFFNETRGTLLAPTRYLAGFIGTDPQKGAGGAATPGAGGGGGTVSSLPNAPHAALINLIDSAAAQDPAAEQGVSVTLRWTDLNPDETNYVVRKRLSTAIDFDSVATLLPTLTEFTDRSVAPDTTYVYVLESTGNGNTTIGISRSEPFTIRTPRDTTPPAIANLSSQLISANAAQITFTTNEPATANVTCVPSLAAPVIQPNFILLQTISFAITQRTAYQCTVRVSDGTGNVSTAPVNLTVSSAATNQLQTAQIPTGLINYKFLFNLNVGSRHSDVRRLQQALNTLGFRIAASGPGSPGNETDFYGVATGVAVRAFQRVSIPNALVAIGSPNGTTFFGPSTRNALNALLVR